MNTEATVYVVDDDELARKSVCALVTSMGVSAECFPSAESFLESYQGDRAGCLVTDVRMIGMSGLELQQQLSRHGIKLPVVVITAYANTPLTVRAMRAGAVTLLEKPCNDHQLWEAIQSALNLDQSRRATLARRETIRQRLEKLNNGERDVLGMMVAGKPNKQIARVLDVSLRTIETRRHNIFKKTETESLAELVRMVIEVEE